MSNRRELSKRRLIRCHQRFPLVGEQLEERSMLSSDSQAFFGFGSISASFPPDQTPIGFRRNELEQQFDARFGADAWKPVIEKAIQTWAQYADVNIGFVNDDGAPAGVYGPTRGDTRFGDIRFFGVSLGSDIWAEAISEQARTAGTWAGDVIFNTEANWRDLEDLETAAVHEIGHILGLPHSDDPLSPMYAHGPSTTFGPTAEDIALLQLLHGVRDPDPNEGGNGNDSIGTASEIKGSDDDETVADGFNGDQVWIQFGDLQSVNDVDVFQVDLAENYTGPIAIQVRSAGLSLARLAVELLDHNGNVVDSGDASISLGSTTIVSPNPTSHDDKYFVRVTSSDAAWTVGDYSITVASPLTLARDAEAIANWTQNVHRWYFDSRGVKNGFSYQIFAANGTETSDDDQHSDDDSASANRLQPAFSSPLRTVFTAVGSISDMVDVDYFRFTTPAKLATGSKLLVDLQSLDIRGLIPDVDLLDRNLLPVVAETLANGYGSTQLLLQNVLPNQTYYLRLDASNVAAQYRVGNFSLAVEISTALTSNDTILSGTLDLSVPLIEKTLYVARTQLLTLSLNSTTSGQAATTKDQVTFRLYNANRDLIESITAPVGQVRSVPGKLLEPGEYYIQVSSATASQLPAIDFQLSGKKPSQPIGPLVAPVDAQPLYACPEGGSFCFPTGTRTPSTTEVGPGPITPLPPPRPLVSPPPDLWFWGPQQPTNPSNRFDVSGDNIVSPLDILLVINYLNTNGSGLYPQEFVGYLDTSADGIVSPLDVLLIINRLNSLLVQK